MGQPDRKVLADHPGKVKFWAGWLLDRFVRVLGTQ